MLRKYVGSAALTLALALILAPALVAQEQPQGQFEGQIDVNEVLLDVLVTDRNGNVIVGLGPSDFVVTESGKPVDITGVTFYSNRRLLESPNVIKNRAGSIDQVPEDRYFVLFFEDQKHAAGEAPELIASQMDAVQRARDWVRKDLLLNDWVAVVSYDAKLKIQQDFTRDRKALVDAINDAMKGKDREGNWPSRIQTEGGAPSLFAGLPRGKELRDQTETVYDAMRLLADSAGDIRGRKNLLLFTNGFPGRINSFGQAQPDPRYYDDMIHALNDNNVAVYPIDLTPAGGEHTLSDTMNLLALDTGGRYFFNFTNFSTPLAQVTQENNGYYLLSFTAAKPAGKSGFQEVEVKTLNPEFRVRARKGYEYGTSSATSASKSTS